MLYRIYSSPLLQEHKRYASQQNHSIRLPHIAESRRKHSSAPFSPCSGSPSSQSPIIDSNNGNSSTPRCPSRLSTSDEATTLENIKEVEKLSEGSSTLYGGRIVSKVLDLQLGCGDNCIDTCTRVTKDWVLWHRDGFLLALHRWLGGRLLRFGTGPSSSEVLQQPGWQL